MNETVVGVQTQASAKITSYIYHDHPHPMVGDYVIVPYGEHELELAQVRTVRPCTTEKDQQLMAVVRMAEPADVAQAQANAQEAQATLTVVQDFVKQHQLDMELVDAHYTFMKEKLLISFTAEGRIDFRQLVRDLAATFQTRIELRQIGVRDEARKVGGYGICGSFLCCSRFLQDFTPVSIRMAKEQDLSLNPTKISGCCGRLLCCLTYENEHYAEHNAHVKCIRQMEKEAEAQGLAEPCRYDQPQPLTSTVEKICKSQQTAEQTSTKTAEQTPEKQPEKAAKPKASAEGKKNGGGHKPIRRKKSKNKGRRKDAHASKS